MKASYKHIMILVLALASINIFAQSEKKLVRKGNNLYETDNYTDAEIEYRKAITKKPDYTKGKFNLGDAMYMQKNYDESSKLFDESSGSSKNKDIKSSSYYNLGNSLLSLKKYRESMEAYKNALRIDPDNQDAKYNYEYARKKMIEQQQKNQDKDKDKDKNKDKNKDKDKKDNKKDNKNDQQKQNQDKNDQDKKNDQQKQNQDQKKNQQQQKQPQQISKQDAQRMLDALKNDEKKTLQKLQRAKAKSAKSTKTDIDW